MLLPSIADARGRNTPQPPRNIVWWVDDDRGVCQLPQFSYYCTEPTTPVSMPTLDSLASTGLRVADFHTTAQCSPSYAQYVTGQYQTYSWVEELNGAFSFAEPTIANEIRRLHPAIATIHVGKPGWGPSNGYCSDDLSVICNYDADCAGTCEYTGNMQADVRDPMKAGFDWSSGATVQNSNYSSFTNEIATREDSGLFSAAQVAETRYREDVHLEDVIEAWDAYADHDGRFMLVGLGNPHTPHHNPGVIPIACTGTDAECYTEQVEYVAEDTLAGFITHLGSELSETCIVYLSDNGSIGTFTSALPGAKFGALDGGTQVGAIFSAACLDDPSLAGATSTALLDSTDLYQWTLRQFGAWAPDLTMPALSDENRMNGQTRQVYSNDPTPLLSGRCDGSGCALVDEYYVSSDGVADTANDRALKTSAYILRLSYEGTSPGDEPWSFFSRTVNRDTNLCTDDACSNLTGATATAFATMRDRMLAIEADAERGTVTPNFTAAAGTPTAGVPFTWRVWSAASTSFTDEAPPSVIVCDIDFDDGNGPVRIVRYNSASTVSPHKTYDMTYGAEDAGAITVTGTCFDSADPTITQAISISTTVAN